MKRSVEWMGRIMLALWFSSWMVACSTAVSANPSAAPVATIADATALPAISTTVPSSTREAPPAFPACDGMQALTGPVKFDWPNLDQHMQEFSRSQWTYFACGEPAPDVAALYRQQLRSAPYSMEETNWLERQEGTLGVYFSQSGAWNYIWFVPQAGDASRSHVIIARTFAYVEC